MNALAILAGCPTGATLDALRAVGVKDYEIVDLAGRGLVASRCIRTLAGDRRLAVLWLYITKEGREALGQVLQ
jgi:hypothetical protein